MRAFAHRATWSTAHRQPTPRASWLAPRPFAPSAPSPARPTSGDSAASVTPGSAAHRFPPGGAEPAAGMAPIQRNGGRTAAKRRQRQKENQARRALERERITRDRERQRKHSSEKVKEKHERKELARRRRRDDGKAARRRRQKRFEAVEPTLRSIPRSRRRQARNQFRPLDRVLPPLEPSQQSRYAQLAKKDPTSWTVSGKGLVLSKEGEKGPFDEDFGDTGTVMWRADTRPPNQVRRTGFTTKAERDLGPRAETEDGRPTGNQVVYRTGTEDIVPATGVCLARDVRGACFFPFEAPEHDQETGTEGAYLYAVRTRRATNTFEAQKQAERAETGRHGWRNPERFHYDPTEAHDEDASAVWPYAEYVTHRVEPEDILGAYHFTRDRLVDPKTPRQEPKSGMGFQIEPKNLIKGKKRRNVPRELADEANETVRRYGRRYPRQPDHFLTYQGTVRRTGKASPMTDSEAAGSAHQIDPFPGSRGQPDAKMRAKLRRQRELAEKKERKQKGKGRGEPKKRRGKRHGRQNQGR